MKKYFNKKGFAHHFVLPVLVIAAVIAIGFMTLRLIKADTITTDGSTFRIATYNIRATRLSKSAWDTKRASAILGYIKSVDIIGLQETQRATVNLGTKHKAVSVANRSETWLTDELVAAGYARTTPTVSPRYGEDNYDNGEDRVIFWNKHKFTMVTQGQNAVTDDVTTNDEIAPEGNESLAKHRNLVWVKLKEITSGKVFYFLTTHLTWGGNTGSYKAVRGTQITQILDYAAAHMTDAPVILVGDMNSRTNSAEDKCFTNGFSDAKNVKNNKGEYQYYQECMYRDGGGFNDAYKIATTKQNMKYSTAIANFKGGLSGDINKTDARHIDHIYVKNGVSVSRVEVVKQKGSDHLPVEADVSL